MKPLFFALLAIISIGGIHAQESSPENSIEVILENFSNDQGAALIALYDQEGFMTQNRIQEHKLTIENGVAKVVLTDIAPGVYSIMALHDKNGNGRMDSDVQGMPLEDWASTGGTLIMGPPTFEETKFEYPGGALQLRLRF